MSNFTAPLQSLNNFFLSVQHDNPELAELIAPDVEVVALAGLAFGTSETGKEAANRLRRVAFDLPEIQSRVLAGALLDLGF